MYRPVVYSGLVVLAAVWLAVASMAEDQTGQPFGFGKLATEEEIKRVDIDVRYDGKGLPAGTGTYAAGRSLYFAQCASCHGSALEGNPEVAGSPLVGEGKTVERYWPYAPPLFDYIRQSMPVSAPGSLSNDQVYNLVAFILGEAGITSKELVMDAESLTQVEMPNRDGFIPDNRPDVP